MLTPKIKVADLKEKIAEVLGYEPQAQRLVNKAKLMLDDNPLDAYSK